MKLLIIGALAVVCVFAEPPVENRYLPPQLGSARSSAPSQTYGAPSQTYGAPGFGVQRHTDAIFRGRQASRSQLRRPAKQYGAPQRTPSALYGAPSAQFSAPSTQYGAPNGQFSAPSSQYGAPNGQFSAPSSQYGAPNGQFSAPSSQYGAPNEQFSAPSSQYGAPNGQFSAPSTKYGAPLGQLSGASGTPSAQYGAPAGPSQQYGAPGFGATGGQLSHGGSGPFRVAEQSRQYLPPGSGRYNGEDGNGEPANYSFEYMVRDEPSGNDFGHREARQGDRAEGLYYVLLPDGRKQTVEYEADQEGYKPRISYEDTAASLGGYDRSNAYQEQGPY